MEKSLVLITNVLTPYRIPLYNFLHKELTKQNITLKILLSAPTYKFRKWSIDTSKIQFELQYLNNFNASVNEKTHFSYLKVWKYIIKQKPNYIIIGGFNIALIIAIILRLFLKYQIIVWSGTVNNTNRSESYIKLYIRKALAFFVQKFIVYGTLAERYIISLKKNAQVFKAYNSIDNNIFYNSNIDLQCEKLQLLYVGNFTKGKRVEKLIEFANELKSRNILFNLKLIGDGPTKNSIQNLINELNLNGEISVLPFMQQSEVISYYHQSHVFLFASNYDVWGLVLNEAMAAGLLVIASPFSGATKDLIQHKETGLIHNFENNNDENINEVVNVLANKQLINNIRLNGQKNVISNINIAKAVQQFIKAIHA